MKAEKEAVTATVINVDVEKDKKKRASKGLVSRLSKKKTPPTQEQLEAASQVAQCNRDDANQAKAKKAAQESKKVDEAQAKANTDEAKSAKEKAEKEAVAATIINVNVGKDPNKKVNKNLVKRLSLKDKIPLTKEQLDAANEVAQANREDALQAKAKKAAQESKKVDEAQVKANTDEAKAAKEKAEKQAVTATIINVNVEKDKKKKASKGLVSRLSKKKAAPTQEQLEAASQVAQCNRDDATQAKAKKAAQESKKVDEAQAKANTDEAKAAKEKAEKQAVAATIINVNVEKDKKKKPSKGLVSRLSKKKEAPTQEQLEAASQVAQCNRNDATQAKVEKAAIESKKMESAQEKATTDQAKGDKKKAEAEIKKMDEERTKKWNATSNCTSNCTNGTQSANCTK